MPMDWWRFIEDILFFWTGSKEELMRFLQFVNSVHPSIQFTAEFDFTSRSVVFLDLRIWVDQDEYVQTNLHVKANSKNAYLLPTSNHPRHICLNIPYSLLYRVKRNCSQPAMCQQRLQELKERLLERGYRSRVIDNTIEKVQVVDREQMLRKVVRDNKNEGRVRAAFKLDKRLPPRTGL